MSNTKRDIAGANSCGARNPWKLKFLQLVPNYKARKAGEGRVSGQERFADRLGKS